MIYQASQHTAATEDREHAAHLSSLPRNAAGQGVSADLVDYDILDCPVHVVGQAYKTCSFVSIHERKILLDITESGEETRCGLRKGKEMPSRVCWSQSRLFACDTRPLAGTNRYMFPRISHRSCTFAMIPYFRGVYVFANAMPSDLAVACNQICSSHGCTSSELKRQLPAV